MPSYRFCRPDDRELLIHAINTCVVPHVPELALHNLDDYQRLLREENFWAGNCMLALGNSSDDVLAGVFGARRGEETCIIMLGARPGEENKGHVSHLVTSLNNKMAILGPPNLRVELPAENSALFALFQKLQFTELAEFRDLIRPLDAVKGSAFRTYENITVEQVDKLGLLGEDAGYAWQRQNQALRNLASELTGLAIVSAERVEAFVLIRSDQRKTFVEVARVFCASEQAGTALGLLFDEIQQREKLPLRLTRFNGVEYSNTLLQSFGFSVERGWKLLHRAATELADP